MLPYSPTSPPTTVHPLLSSSTSFQPLPAYLSLVVTSWSASLTHYPLFILPSFFLHSSFYTSSSPSLPVLHLPSPHGGHLFVPLLFTPFIHRPLTISPVHYLHISHITGPPLPLSLQALELNIIIIFCSDRIIAGDCVHSSLPCNAPVLYTSKGELLRSPYEYRQLVCQT